MEPFILITSRIEIMFIVKIQIFTQVEIIPYMLDEKSNNPGGTFTDIKSDTFNTENLFF